ncbi:hypothetical protein [Rhodococcus sp. USK13]|uniref:hypothetical protein n=1 Tax=Rhodococcus sp. USK13 TaxID=2806442 RepID=UPI001BCBAD26|nr:hypothetical protein [Rhodococcus sp. USK13]
MGFALAGFLYGPLLTYLTELFKPNRRQTDAGLSYQIGAVFGGRLAPSVANRLIEWTGHASSVGYYLAAGMEVTLACLLVLPETAPQRLKTSSAETVGFRSAGSGMI